jgi:hypothetical protein
VSASALFLLGMLILFQGLMEDLCVWQDIDFLQRHGLIVGFSHLFFHFKVNFIFGNLGVFTDVDIFLILFASRIGIGDVPVVFLEVE